jgi:tetratricopeptide (TPR) repeat protein
MNSRVAKQLLALIAVAACLHAQSSESREDLLAIQDALQIRDFATALRLIDQAVKRDRNDAAVINLRGVLHAQREELPEARQDFATAVKLAPALTPAWQNLARACQLQSEKDASAVPCATESWQRVLRLKSQDEEAHGSLALLYEKTGKFAESLREVEHLPPNRLTALILRCADLTALGRIDEATKAAQDLSHSNEFSEADFAGVQKAFESPQAAPVVVILVKALDARQAADVISLRRLAIAYEQLEKPAEARHVLERVAVLDPKNTAHLLELARLADAAGDHEAALGYLAHARDLAPDSAQIHFLFAMIANEMELPVQARASLDRALALEPNNPAYNFAMGVVILSSTRDAATAGTYFQKFVAARPDSVKGHYALGVAYFASGDYAKSKAEMQKVTGKKEVAGGPEYFLGCMARREHDLETATRFLRESIELMPGFAESHTELARIFMTQGDLAKARSELDAAVRIDPKSFGANSQLLAVYRRTHDPRAEAQADLVKKLDENRSKRAELMLRMIDARPIEQAARQIEKPLAQ